MPPKEKVMHIMQNKDYNVITHLATFIYIIIDKTFSHPGWNMSIKLYYGTAVQNPPDIYIIILL